MTLIVYDSSHVIISKLSLFLFNQYVHLPLDCSLSATMILADKLDPILSLSSIELSSNFLLSLNLK